MEIIRLCLRSAGHRTGSAVLGVFLKESEVMRSPILVPSVPHMALQELRSERRLCALKTDPDVNPASADSPSSGQENYGNERIFVGK